MKIQEIHVARLDIPYLHRFPTSFTVYESVRNVIVKLVTDEGLVGVGEAAPLPGLYGETQDSVVGAVKFTAPVLLGEDPRSIVKIHQRLDRLLPIGNFTAKCAIDVALHDLAAQSMGVPLYQYLGGRTRDTYQTHIATRPGTTHEMVAEIQSRVDEGFRVFKVKAGGDAEKDLERIKAMLDAAPDGILLSVDVNQGWNHYETHTVIDRIVRHPTYRANVMIEQPTRSQDIDNLAQITRNSPIPIIADDGVCTKEQALTIIQKQAAHIINIKISKAGGLYRAKQIVGLCEAAGMPYIIDEITETRVCGTAVSHLALTVSGLVYGGCTCHRHLRDDPVAEGGLRIDDGMVSVEELPGLGLILDEAFVRFERVAAVS
jgi:L-Ala-D/L-Glu epimerase